MLLKLKKAGSVPWLSKWRLAALGLFEEEGQLSASLVPLEKKPMK